jgi:hypothetical protein
MIFPIVSVFVIVAALLMDKHDTPGSNKSSTTSTSSSTETEMKRFYPIGTPGEPWTDAERAQWKSETKIQRSYQDEVLTKIEKLGQGDLLVVEQYGALSHDPKRYPLFVVKTKDWQADKPCVLVTGGVHGYETSGVQGALLFLQSAAPKYAKDFNIVVAPCVSPWAYEHIQRWQAEVKDPNRSFKTGEETEESKALMTYLKEERVEQPHWRCHLDLHETTDTDSTEFMPAKHAEAGLMYSGEVIPDGFYLVGNDENPQLEFQQAVIESVRKVTHIAPPDDNGNIIGEPVVKDGLIIVPAKKLGLCGGMTAGTYTTTTEVYPDSPRATDDICNQAQVAAITGALDYILSQKSSS